jgi:hypothetical protein
MVGHGQQNLMAYYVVSFNIMQFHKYSLSEMESLIPWERDIYLSLLEQHIEDENRKIQQQGLNG